MPIVLHNHCRLDFRGHLFRSFLENSKLQTYRFEIFYTSYAKICKPVFPRYEIQFIYCNSNSHLLLFFFTCYNTEQYRVSLGLFIYSSVSNCNYTRQKAGGDISYQVHAMYIPKTINMHFSKECPS